MNWEKVAAACGVVFVILLLIVQFGFGQPPSAGQPLVDFYRNHHDSVQIRELLSGLAGAFFLLFAGSLRSTLRRDEGADSWASSAMFGAALTTAALAFADAIVIYSLAFRTPSNPDVAEAIQSIASVFGRFLSLPLAVFLAAASMVVLRGRSLPSWVGWLGLLGAGLNLLSAFRIAVDVGGPLSSAALLAVALWIALVSVLLTAGRGTSSDSG